MPPLRSSSVVGRGRVEYAAEVAAAELADFDPRKSLLQHLGNNHIVKPGFLVAPGLVGAAAPHPAAPWAARTAPLLLSRITGLLLSRVARSTAAAGPVATWNEF